MGKQQNPKEGGRERNPEAKTVSKVHRGTQFGTWSRGTAGPSPQVSPLKTTYSFKHLASPFSITVRFPVGHALKILLHPPVEIRVAASTKPPTILGVTPRRFSYHRLTAWCCSSLGEEQCSWCVAIPFYHLMWCFGLCGTGKCSSLISTTWDSLNGSLSMNNS